MIETLGTNVLEHIVPFMDHLLNFLPIRVPSSVMEYFQLVTQIVSRFKVRRCESSEETLCSCPYSNRK